MQVAQLGDAKSIQLGRKPSEVHLVTLHSYPRSFKQIRAGDRF
jgi:hypothetical protein